MRALEQHVGDPRFFQHGAHLPERISNAFVAVNGEDLLAFTLHRKRTAGDKAGLTQGCANDVG